MIDWNSESFHPVVNLPEDYKILDLTKGPWISGDSGFSIGKYDEFTKRWLFQCKRVLKPNGSIWVIGS